MQTQTLWDIMSRGKIKDSVALDCALGECEVQNAWPKEAFWVNGEVPRFADHGYGYVLTIPKVCTYSQSATRPDFSDYGYGYV